MAKINLFIETQRLAKHIKKRAAALCCGACRILREGYVEP